MGPSFSHPRGLQLWTGLKIMRMFPGQLVVRMMEMTADAEVVAVVQVEFSSSLVMLHQYQHLTEFLWESGNLKQRNIQHTAH